MTNTTPADEGHPHYAWGASAAKTWRGCPGSINYIAQEREAGNIPEDTSSSYAEEGTTAHDYAEKVLTGQIDFKVIPDEFAEHLGGYIDFAESLTGEVGDGDCVVMNEQAVPLFYNPKAVGTVDYSVIAEDGSEIAVLDLKYGAGVYVPAEDNDQLAIYALSLVKSLESDGYPFTDDTTVRMFIYQPRHHEFTGEPETWVLSLRELLDLGIDIEESYQASKAAEPTDLHPSKDACQFCDARVICQKRVLDMFEEVPEEANMLVPSNHSDEINLPDIGSLTDEARVAIHKHRREITKWMEDVDKDTLKRMEAGDIIPGMKVVLGKAGNRTWSDPDAVSGLLRKIPAGDRFQPRKLKSPAQLEKVLKADGQPLDKRSGRFQTRWHELITQRPGRPTLALIDDPRPSLPVGPDIFDVLPDPDRPPRPNLTAEEMVDVTDCF